MNRIIEEDLVKITNDKSIDWKRFYNKSILITGANGMLPAYLVRTLLFLNSRFDYNVTVFALVRNVEKAKSRFIDYLNNPHLVLVPQDVSNDIILKDHIDFVIHAASQASPKYYGIDPVGTINANILGTINTLKLAKDNNVEGYLFFSSGDVYGIVDPIHFPFGEKDYGYIDLLNVRSCYGESKRMGENLCIAWSHQYHVPTKIARIFHTYGPGMLQDDHRVFADFCYNVVNNENIKIKSDGQAVRVFCYITDATRAFFKILLDGEIGNAYNVANARGEISILNLAKLIVKLYPEKELHIEYDNNTDISAGIMKSPLIRAIPNCEKLKALGWDASIPLEEGFRRAIDSLKL